MPMHQKLVGQNSTENQLSPQADHEAILILTKTAV